MPETIVGLNEYQDATETVAVYLGNNPNQTAMVADTILAELVGAMTQPGALEEGAAEGMAVVAPLMNCLRHIGLFYCTFGLAGEAGEFCEKVKKMLRDSGGKITPEIRMTMAQELGDVLWYVSQASKQIGVDLQTVANLNMKKLLDRKGRGVLGGSGDSR